MASTADEPEQTSGQGRNTPSVAPSITLSAPRRKIRALSQATPARQGGAAAPTSLLSKGVPLTGRTRQSPGGGNSFKHWGSSRGRLPINCGS